MASATTALERKRRRFQEPARFPTVFTAHRALSKLLSASAGCRWQLAGLCQEKAVTVALQAGATQLHTYVPQWQVLKHRHMLERIHSMTTFDVLRRARHSIRMPSFKRRRAFKNQLSTWARVAPDIAASDCFVNRLGYGPAGSFKWHRNQSFKTMEALRGSFVRVLSCADLRVRCDRSVPEWPRPASQLVCGDSRMKRLSECDSSRGNVWSLIPEWTERIRCESATFSARFEGAFGGNKLSFGSAPSH